MDQDSKPVATPQGSKRHAHVRPKLPLNLAGFEKALLLTKHDLRRNVRNMRIERWFSNGGFHQLTDGLEAWTQTYIEGLCANTGKEGNSWRVSKQRWEQLRDAYLVTRHVDPFKDDYLQGLMEAIVEPLHNSELEDQVIERAFLSNWLGDLFDFDAPWPLVQWASRYCFLAPVQRVYDPGCKLDEVPVLIGPQDCGKSALAANIVPPEHMDEWFTDNLDLSADPKVHIEAMLGRVVVELSEMSGINRKEQSALKAFITRQNDGGIRLAYHRHPIDMPRRCVFIGTANDDCLPNDPSGNRRFVALKIKGKRAKHRVEDFMDEHREMLFGEALLLYHHYYRRANLPGDCKELQRRNNDQHRVGDEALEDAVEHVLREYFPDRRAKLTEVTRDTNARTVHTYHSKQVSDAMALCGWTKTRTKEGRFWVPGDG